MCWCFNFGFQSKPKNYSSNDEKRRRDAPADGALHGKGRPVVAEVQEKRRSKDSSKRRRSTDVEMPRSSRRIRNEVDTRPHYQHGEVYPGYEQHRPAVNVQIPALWQRPVYPEGAYSRSTRSSQETLLNPRPHRSTHQRQRHPKHTSQGTLRGRGAKRDPPKSSKSKKSLRAEPTRGWSFFAPSPPKTSSRRNYQTLDTSPRSQRSSRQHRSSSQYEPSSPSRSRQQRSRQHEQQAPTVRSARSRTPNTAARRVPDRRFAVLAATNQALETVRRDAFAQPSPPPRRERLRRYGDLSIPTSQVPFNWDCVSSSQASGGYEDSSTRRRRSQR